MDNGHPRPQKPAVMDPLASAVHNEHWKATIIAHALQYVSRNFDAFVDDIARPETKDELKELLSKQLFDIWIYPVATRPADPDVQVGVMPVSPEMMGGLAEAMRKAMGQFS